MLMINLVSILRKGVNNSVISFLIERWTQPVWNHQCTI